MDNDNNIIDEQNSLYVWDMSSNFYTHTINLSMNDIEQNAKIGIFELNSSNEPITECLCFQTIKPLNSYPKSVQICTYKAYIHGQNYFIDFSNIPNSQHQLVIRRFYAKSRNMKKFISSISKIPFRILRHRFPAFLNITTNNEIIDENTQWASLGEFNHSKNSNLVGSIQLIEVERKSDNWVWKVWYAIDSKTQLSINKNKLFEIH
eukprot:136050_1